MDGSFYKISIQKIERQTKDSISVELNIPKEYKRKFQFIAGQYVSIKHKLNGKTIIRDYSLASSPKESVFRIGIKKTNEKGFSEYAVSQAKEDDVWLVSPPKGRFVLDYKPNEKRVICCFAAGSGITPIISHCKQLLYEEPHSHVNLFYGNKTKANIIFNEELKRLEKSNSKFHVYHFFTVEKVNDPLFFGRFTPSKIKLIFNQLVDINDLDKVLICGPKTMTSKLISTLIELGIPNRDIHFELFSPLENLQLEKKVKKKGKQINRKPVHVCVYLDGEEHEFIMKDAKSSSLLDAILENGIDAPYSCKGGICGTCQCKIKHGKVEIDNDLVLTDEDIKEGWILACQSFPTTDSLVVSFD